MRLVLSIILFFSFYQNVTAQVMTKDQIKQLALEAILENPEIIMQAVTILQQREKERAASGANTVRLQLESDPNAPNLGNPEGDVTVVEFSTIIVPIAGVQVRRCKRSSRPMQMYGSSIVNGQFWAMIVSLRPVLLWLHVSRANMKPSIGL